MSNIKIKKQSLIDWQATTDNGAHIGWITKAKHGGYNVTFNWNNAPYWVRTFKDARALIAI